MRGSLRWLEHTMRERGANPNAVRNVLYRGVGTGGDKRALFELLRELHAEAGLPTPDAPEPLEDRVAHVELLGRSKRLAFRQFMSALKAGRAPRLIVTGRAGVGKTLLIEHLEREIARLRGAPSVTRLLLEGESAPALQAALDRVGGDGGALARLHERLPYAVQAEWQAEAARALRGRVRGVLLIRAGTQGTFAGVPPRLPGGAATSLGVWAHEHLLRGLPDDVAALLALDDAVDLVSPAAEVLPLKPPTAEEARRYLMARLPLAPGEADTLLRAAGRNLDRLALLSSVRGLESGDAQGAARLLRDTHARALIAALAVTLPDGAISVPRWHLEAALGRPIADLPPHARQLLDEVNEAAPRPVSRSLVPTLRAHLKSSELHTTHRRAAAALLAGTPDAARTEAAVLHLAHLNDWDGAVNAMALHSTPEALAARTWSLARRTAQGAAREVLARETVRHHARLGQYDHPDAREALSVLLEHPASAVRAWARVKLAESAVERGAFDAADAQLAALDAEVPPGGQDAWARGARVDAALVRAAVLRWRGDLPGATRAVQEATRVAPAPLDARVLLWRGLIAKDRGDYPAAVADLTAVAERDPLSRGRALYQAGDLRLRFGQPFAALAALREALGMLEAAHAAAEERARVTARLGTALRRVGRLDEAWPRLQDATRLAQDTDPVLMARIESETVPLLLARGQADEALLSATRALARLADAPFRPDEAAYRARRTRYRMALAYLTRAMNVPYLNPFPGALSDHPDLQAARALLDAHLALPWGDADRDRTLRLDALLSRALAEPDAARAASFVDAAMDLADQPYAEAQARAAMADVRWRAGDAAGTLALVNRAHALARRVTAGLVGEQATPDPGLTANLLTLEARALMRDGDDPKHTVAWLHETLSGDALAPFRAGVWREVGVALEAYGAAGWAAARATFPHLPDVPRLPDALRFAAGMGTARAEQQPVR